MAEGISVFSPSIAGEIWVEQGGSTLLSEAEAIEIDFTPTIFQVPKSLKETKPRAYTPSLLGLGPYHHLRPDLHATHARKLGLIKKYQARVGKNFSELSIRRMMGLEVWVRASYDKYLDIRNLTMAYIVSVDSFYLLDFLGAYGPRTGSTVLGQPGHRELVEDVLMLENQIPGIALLEVGKQISLFSPESGANETMLHSQLFYYFCKAHSPLRLTGVWKDRRQKSSHLLAHMYYLIVNNRGFEEVEMASYARSKIGAAGIEILTALSELGLGGAMIKPLLFAFKAMEVLENSMLTKEITSIDKEPKEQEAKRPTKIHEIPAASELSKKHKLGFILLEKQGIKDIKLESLDSIPMLHLPEITLEQHSEVVLRNLIAYEAAIAAAASTAEPTIELAEYIDLMGDLLRTPQDAALLREKNILKGSLSDEQVVGIFAGIGKPQGKSKEECASQKVGRLLKEMEKKDETKWRRLHGSLKKRVNEGVEVMRKPCAMALKYVLYIFLVVLVVLQLMQAYCQVYGCNKGGSKSN